MGFPFGGNGTPLKFSELQTEFGGSNPVSFSEYYRSGSLVTDNNIDVPTSGVISMSEFYGSSKKFTVTVSSSGTNLTASALLSAAGWNSASFFQITINSGVTAYATSTGNSGLTVSGSYPYGFAVVNNGAIMGMGGQGGSDSSLAGGNGGPALSLSNSYTTAQMSVTNGSGAFIAGGGGGGGGQNNGEIKGGGGGGAGGGAGGLARQVRGGYFLGAAGAGGGLGAAGGNGTGTGDAITPSIGGGAGGGGGGYELDGISATRDGGCCGAGGGRILPGSGGAGGGAGAAVQDGGAGGSGGSVGGNGEISGARGGAGGGGGWGAAGGTGIGDAGNVGGGAGGAAILKNGSTITVTNSGTLYGSVLA
jgi:hypothetical protein